MIGGGFLQPGNPGLDAVLEVRSAPLEAPGAIFAEPFTVPLGHARTLRSRSAPGDRAQPARIVVLLDDKFFTRT